MNTFILLLLDFLISFAAEAGEQSDQTDLSQYLEFPISTPLNPLMRDTEEIPSSIKDKKKDYTKGDNLYLLVTTFIEGIDDTGKVWVVPYADLEDTYTLITGLQKPVGVCFDINHSFLYVADLGNDSVSASIYQYEIEWDSENYFMLKRNVFVIIYEGDAPYDCSIDEYGNLYFVDYVKNQINLVSYLDLYAGFKNTYYTIYDEASYVSSPISLEVYESSTLFYINNVNGDELGTLNSLDLKFADALRAEILVKTIDRGYGMAYSEEERAFFSLGDGSIWTYDEDGTSISYSNFDKPKGMCYADGVTYLADFAKGIIFSLSDKSGRQLPGKLIEIQGSYGLACVNSYALGLLSLFSMAILI